MACIKEITKDSGLYKSLLSFLPEDTVESLIRSVNGLYKGNNKG
nr:MAG TPA: vacuolar protein sorting-associated protein [Crassvirales sp.]